MFRDIDRRIIGTLNHWSLSVLRIALACVYIWFGALKIAGVSPAALLVQTLYPSFPEPAFLTVLGIWEILIGVGLLYGQFLRTTLALLWLQMGGIFLGLITRPDIFFQHSNPFLLTLEGEFVIKNLVLIAASLVIGGYQIKPRR